jgi:hypothetical protein
MKKIFLLFILIVSCKNSRSIINENDLGAFKIENLESDMLSLYKKEATLTIDGEIEQELSYTIKVPYTLKEIKSTLTVMPNKNELVFDSNQKVLIFGNKKSTSVNKTSLPKDDFLEELKKYKLFENVINEELKGDRYFGIHTSEHYVIIYLNVKQKNIDKFNGVLLSQKF